MFAIMYGLKREHNMYQDILKYGLEKNEDKIMCLCKLAICKLSHLHKQSS